MARHLLLVLGQTDPKVGIRVEHHHHLPPVPKGGVPKRSAHAGS
jgi:hypothetical protein